MIMGKRILLTVCVFAVFLLSVAPAMANQNFADRTEKECEFCHVGEPADLEFTPEGESFIENFYDTPAGWIIIPIVAKKARRLLLALHGVAGYALLGWILFVGFTRPREIESRDLSSRERKYIGISLATVGLSGVALLPFVITGDFAWKSYFGLSLGLKTALFAVIAFTTAYQLLSLSGKIAELRGKNDESSLNRFRLLADRYCTILKFNFIFALSIIIITTLWRIE